jgi:hypothetical protein
MTIISAEVLRVRDNINDFEYDVLLTFNETRSDSLSRLDIEAAPLVRYAKVGDRLLMMQCQPTPRLTFDLAIAHSQQSAQFATQRDVLLPAYLHSCGLGNYIFSKLISWGQATAPAAVFQRLTLSHVDAETEVAKQRRNGFYRSLNFALDFSQDAEEKNGRCIPAALETLMPRPANSKKILSLRPLAQALRSELIKNGELANTVAEKTATNDFLQESLALQAQRSRKWAKYCAFSLVALGILAWQLLAT